MRPMKEKFLWLEEFAGLNETYEKFSVWITIYTTATCIRLWAMRIRRNMSRFTWKMS